MESIGQDVRYAVRLLLKDRRFSIVALLTLAFGIGATAALFCVVDAVLIHPLPYPHPERLVRVSLTYAADADRRYAPSIDDMDVWRTVPGVFSHLGTWRNANVIVADGEPERANAELVDGGYMPTLGIQPLIGRPITAADAAPTADPVVLLGYRFWLTRYGGRLDVLGQTIHFASDSATIVGVLPAWVPDDAAVWRPLVLTQAAREARQYSVFGRLLDGVTIDEAQRRLATVSSRLNTSNVPGAGRQVPIATLRSLATAASASERPTVEVLVLAVGFVLLIACVNVASLQLARGATRRTELAVRTALGAGRLRVIRQLLVENVVLSAAGAALGVLLAWVLLGTLMANVPVDWPSRAPASLSPTVLVATAAIAILTGLAFGLAPALTLARVAPASILSRALRGTRAALSRRASRALVAIEVGAAVVLLTCAALMARSFARLDAVDLGFHPEQFVTLEAAPVEPNADVYATYYAALLDRIRALPGVEAAGATDQLPLGGSYTFATVTSDVDAGKTPRPTQPSDVLPGYFEATGIPLLAGRLPTEQDRTSHASIAVVSAMAAKDLFPGVNPIGRSIFARWSPAPFTVIGVVGDISHIAPDEPQRGKIYILPTIVASARGPARPEAMTVVVKVRGDSSAMFGPLRQAAQSVGPKAFVRRLRRGEDWWQASVTTPRQRTVLLGLLGGLGVLLALVGVFGVTAFAVARRTPEIGVRLALGARPADVVRTMLADTAWPLGIGLALGLAGAAFATRLVAGFLFETAPRDPATFAGVAAALLVAGTLAAWLPARRAARVDPSTALRDN